MGEVYMFFKIILRCIILIGKKKVYLNKILKGVLNCYIYDMCIGIMYMKKIIKLVIKNLMYLDSL